MKNKKEISLIKIMCKVFPMIFGGSYSYSFLVISLGILHGVSFGVATLATQKFFDTVTRAINSGEGVKKIILSALVLGVVTIASQVLNGVHNFLGMNFGKKMSGYLSKKINEKSAKIDPIVYENTELLDNINKAQIGVEGSINLAMVTTSLFTFYLPYFIFMGTYLFKLNKILILSLIFIFIPTIIVQFIRVKVFDNLEDEVAPIRREYGYYENCICDREYFKETRILGAFSYFRNLYSSSMELLAKKVWKAERKTGLIELGMRLLTLAGYFGVLYLLFYSLFKGKISIGAFSAVFASIDLMFAITEEIICRHIGSLTRELGTIRNFVDFFDLPERGGKDVTLNSDYGISLKNVNFKYPLAKECSLKDICLDIKGGETIAIVGENGAGKTTLVKLLTGLYLPTEGTVEIGGFDVKNVSSKAIYKGISGVFQKYQRYKMKLSENILISNAYDKNSEELLQSASMKADLDVNSESFPNGYETMLSREFDGVDISGGQWQRVAIARGFYRSHNMIVLDEPTAAIDPIEETQIYNKFASMSKGKTAVIVTHRLGSAKIADRIVVMDEGHIAEIGTHEELMNNKGKYAEMYEAQAQWYVRDEVAGVEVF